MRIEIWILNLKIRNLGDVEMELLHLLPTSTGLLHAGSGTASLRGSAQGNYLRSRLSQTNHRKID
jgi:hypothetical protein